jgi:hypothetical protein
MVAVLQKLILFEEKHNGDAAGGGHLVPVGLRDSDLVERQHDGRLARLIGDVHCPTIFRSPYVNGYESATEMKLYDLRFGSLVNLDPVPYRRSRNL